MSSKTSSRPRSGPTTPSPPPPPSSSNISNGKPNAWARPLQPSKGPPPGMGAPPILRERFLHLTLTMVGQKVVVTKMDGTVVEGIFHTFTPFSSHSPELKNKYVLRACKGEDVTTGATVIMDASDVANVHVKSMRLDTKSTTNGEAFRTDVEISASQNDKNRDLVAAGSAWTTTTTGPSSRAEGLAATADTSRITKGLKGNIGEWDQFKANEQLFNVSATYDENLYTTELDHSQIDKRKKMEAARLAKEIENTTSSNIHVSEERGHKIEGDYDEEDRYSGVLKPSLQPRNVDPKTTAKQPVKPAGDKAGATAKGVKADDAAKSAAPAKMNYAAAAAKAKADAKAAVPPGFVKPALVSPGSKDEDGAPLKKDEKKEEENGVAGKTGEESPAPVTPTKGDAKKDAEAKEKTDGKKEKTDEAKGEEESTEKKEEKKPATKLNANAKSFSFNPSAKTFTPSFGGAPPAAAPPAETYPVDPNTGMPIGGPGLPQMPAQYMPHPGMAQPGMVPMMNAPYAPMRYPAGPYPGMEHQMPMPVPPQQPQHAQQPPSAPGSQQPSAPGSQQPSAPTSVDGGSPAPLASGDEASEGTAPPPPQQPPQQLQQQQQPGQPVQQMAYAAGGPPGTYYPAGMMPPPRGAPGGYPPPPQMVPPGGNPYAHPMYGGPMPMAPNMMRGPQGNYYPPMGGMHYPPGVYGGGMMDDDQGYRVGRGRSGGGRGAGRRSGRKSGRGGRGNYYGGSSGGGSGRQTPQSTTSGVSDNGDGGESKTSASPSEEPLKPSGEE